MTEQNTFAIVELQQKANDGDAQAQFDLAYCYIRGKDVAQNRDLAFEWLRKTVEQSHADAQFSMGLYYFLHADQKYFSTLLCKGANHPDIERAHYLAAFLALPIGMQDADDNQAILWFKKASEQNHAEANYWLGLCYWDGIGTQQNDEFAFDCFRIAVEQGFIEAQYWLARCYFDGKGVEQSNARAFELFEMAAEQGISEAQYWLACCYFDGTCVEQNNELALNWLEKAANHDHVEAEIRLAECYTQGVGVEKSDEQAFKWHTRAAHKNHVKSQYWLARYYLSGGILEQLDELNRTILETRPNEYRRNVYLKKGYERAFDWAVKAVKNGCGEAYLLLGFMYAYGIGVDQSDEQAFVWFKNAVGYDRDGITDYFLADFYAQGRGSEQNANLAALYSKKADPKKVRQFYNVQGLLANADETLEIKLLRLSTNLHIACENFDLARTGIKEHNLNNPDEMHFGLVYVDKAEQLARRNKELEEKNKKLEEAEKELEDMMSMFAHKFRSPLDAIIYNTTHENQVKLYTEAAQTMRGLLNIFSIISTDAEILKDKIKQDGVGSGRLTTVFSKTLDMILLHLLSVSGTEKIQQHYMAYAKAHEQCDAQVCYKTWCEDYFELEQSLQAEWEQSFALLLNQSATLEQRLAWLEQHFFKLKLIGFERSDIQFKEYGVTESFLTILLNEILVNAFKYYSSASKHPVILEWTEREGYQVLICRNPSIRSERTIIKGSHKGQAFLSTLARKTGSIFTKPTPQDDFVVEFGIPDELLISK